ncbi:restriction endonuclease [Microvirga guangxiensis]|uniref:Restriction system protein n=1 Tax=Microvirga guangxiensis TaxID=549386 RepID=A0A1G5L9A3_9HYPH|nr:restriction endonuclease [Microvirga guangxiensis]SCZ08908.1 restriction system protein [Microvirga guangxiensis]
MKSLKDDLPKFDALMLPTIQALKALGGSASNEELVDHVADKLKLSEELRNIPSGKGSRSELAYRMAWARTYLKGHGAVDNSERGVWSLTDKGESITETDIEAIKRNVRMANYEARKSGATAKPASDEAEVFLWNERLLETVQSIPPDAFERLCQRILRESGFTRVDITGKSGDGGIDGIGVLRMHLVSFHVLFQCKRWKGSVGSNVVRDFRGAMVGRADKGLIITTGTFTSEARREAARDGAPAIDLVDGESLCALLKDLKLGVKVRLVEEVEIEEAFFRSI